MGDYPNIYLVFYPTVNKFFKRVLSQTMTRDFSFSDLVQTRLDELGETPHAAAIRSGVPYEKFRSVLRTDARRVEPKLGTVKAICDALNLDFHIGPPRDTGPIEQIEIAGDDYAHIPVHDATLSAGGGFNNGDSVVVDHLAFKKEWLRKISVAPSNAVLARIDAGQLGQSMMPTIHPGDMVLIDTSKREIPISASDYKARKAPIYAFSTDEGARVKRLSMVGDIIALISDNPDFAPELLARNAWASSNVIGKVVWWGHTVKD